MSEKSSKIIHVLFGVTILAVSFVIISRVLDMFLGNKVNDGEVSSVQGIDLNGSSAKVNRS